MSLFLHQLRAEQLTFWRSREAAVFVFLFPIVLFLLLTAVYDDEIDGQPAVDYLLAGLLGYGVANTMFGGLAIALVFDRELALLKRIRATPLPASTYLAATVVSHLLVFCLQSVTLLLIGRFVFGAELPGRPVSLVLALALGAFAFGGIGLAAAALIRSSEGSSAVVNLIILPMAFLAGSFGPTQDFPAVLDALAQALPLKHLLDVVTGIFVRDEPAVEHPVALAALVAWGVAGIAVAARRFGWEPRAR